MGRPDFERRRISSGKDDWLVADLNGKFKVDVAG
jgi:hypothetical protein